jgi:hypothetical protein
MVSVSRPLSAATECFRALGGTGDAGMYLASSDVLAHPYDYYFRTVGPVVRGSGDVREQVIRRLTDTRTPVVIAESDWLRVRAAATDLEGTPPALPSGVTAMLVEPTVLLMLPGRYATCLTPVLAGGGEPYEPSRRGSR